MIVYENYVFEPCNLTKKSFTEWLTWVNNYRVGKLTVYGL